MGAVDSNCCLTRQFRSKEAKLTHYWDMAGVIDLLLVHDRRRWVTLVQDLVFVGIFFTDI